MPGPGWVGVDPTNDVEAGLRHIRVAIGRDYADVPPTRGVYKGGAATSLDVSVQVTPGEALPTLDTAVVTAAWTAEAEAPDAGADTPAHEQAQQQQQQ